MTSDEAGLETGGVPDAVEAVATLGDGMRRRLYSFVRGRTEPVSRDEAAGAVGISSRLAAFHLDKLVRKGLLRAHYARKRGRSGPGAGRSSKFYEPTAAEISVSIPARRYDVVGRILVEAVGSCDDAVAGSVREAAERVARADGEELGRRERRQVDSTTENGLAAVGRVLARHGFEPRRTAGQALTLRNCPFDSLARHHPELVCAINEAFIDGVIEGIDASAVRTELRPVAGQCCVQLLPSGRPVGGW